MSNILFIGGAGFIGSSIIRNIVRSNDGNEISVLEPENADIKRLKECPIRLFRGSISDTKMIENIIQKNKIDTIVHLVSTLLPGSSYEDYEKEFENVVFPTIKITQLCSKNGIKFIFFSSGGTVYGDRSTLESFLEKDPKEPISYYGLSKQMIENSILFEHRVSGLKYLILRPSNPYGYGQNLYGNQGLIAVALGKILKGDCIDIWGDGSAIRDYIYIEDLAEAVRQLIDLGVKNTTINIGSGKGYSVMQIINILKEVVDENVRVNYTSQRKADVSNVILNNNLLLRVTDIKFMDIKDGIRNFYLDVKSSM